MNSLTSMATVSHATRFASDAIAASIVIPLPSASRRMGRTPASASAQRCSASLGRVRLFGAEQSHGIADRPQKIGGVSDGVL